MSWTHLGDPPSPSVRGALHKVGHIRMTGIVVTKSRLHIGSSNDDFREDGIENSCIKDAVTGVPYLPGSSLKGVMRHRLEKRLNRFKSVTKRERGRPYNGKDPCACARPKCPVCLLFGPHGQRAEVDPGRMEGPSRLIVRDAYPVNWTGARFVRGDGARGGIGKNTVECVPIGTRFRIEVALQVFDRDSSFTYSPFQPGTEANASSPSPLRGDEALLELLADACNSLTDPKLDPKPGSGGRIGARKGQDFGILGIPDGTEWEADFERITLRAKRTGVTL